MAVALQKYFDDIKTRVDAGDGELSNIDKLNIILPYIFNIKGYDRAVSENDPAFVSMAEFVSERDGENFDFSSDPATLRIVGILTRSIQDVISELDNNAVNYFNGILNNTNEPTLSSLSGNADFSSLLSRIGEKVVENDTNNLFYSSVSIRTKLPTDINNVVDLSSITNWIGSSLISSLKEYFEERINNMDDPTVDASVIETDPPAVNYPTPESNSIENEFTENDLPFEVPSEDVEMPVTEPVTAEPEQETVSELPFPSVEEIMPEPDETMLNDNMVELGDDPDNKGNVNQDVELTEEAVEELVEPTIESDSDVTVEAETHSFEKQNHTLEEITSNITNSEAVGFSVPENETIVDDKTFFENTKDDVAQTTESSEVKESEEKVEVAEPDVSGIGEQQPDVEIADNEPVVENNLTENANDNSVVEDVVEPETEEILAYAPDEEHLATADDLPETGRFAVKTTEPVVEPIVTVDDSTQQSQPETEKQPKVERVEDPKVETLETKTEIPETEVANVSRPMGDTITVANTSSVSDKDIVDMLSGFTQESAINSVAEHPAALKWVKQNMRNCMEAVSINGLALEYVKKPNYFIDRAAVKQNGLAIQFVKNQTSALQVEAIKQNPLSIYAIKKPSPAAILMAIKKNYDAIRYNQMPGLPESSKLPCDSSIAQGVCSLFRSSLNQHICNELVSIDPNNIRYIPAEYQTPRMCKRVVMEDPHTIQFIVNNRMTDRIQHMAIEGNPYCIGLIPNPSLELCARAFELDKNTFDMIPKDIREQFVKDFGLDAPTKNDDAR